ncbi:hypothetical protein BMR1_03g02995 [Babesia microti strain RI]|uniref:Uncharacterized protein n=1 Tax=Babesia microti (strain RI) TaxID=1133968 RepID=A0A0K3AN99_BABMR|nr:hypothetical protein BMR1_03g02995 [Babesia microti strain RI]CTQ41199.1 hypothetical protein BMR1_03g02995 [Babesia microti strain RI]|eukprot:XP_012649210.1 hypothetical protein BMR1_03g02995 [Babesia microti strain RI]
MIDSIYEKPRHKKLKGIKYYKNKRRQNVTLVYSDPVAIPSDNTFDYVENYELTSQESNSICTSPKKRTSKFKHFKIDIHKAIGEGRCNVYEVPIIGARTQSPVSVKSFENQLDLFRI